MFSQARDRRWHSRADTSLFIPFALWLADRLRFLLVRSGVDYPIFRELLRTKLVLELRSGSLGASGHGAQLEGMFTIVLLVFFLLGFLVGAGGLLLEDDAMLWVGGSLGLHMGMVALMLLTQYAHILVDTTDIEVLAPKPIPDSTLFATRLVHMLVYVGALTIAFTVPAMFLAIFRQPPIAVLFAYPLGAMLATVFAVGLVSLLFTITLRLVGPARYQRFALWIQVGAMSLMLGGSQLVHLLGDAGPGAFSFFKESHLYVVLPPVHLAGMFQLVAGEFTRVNVAYTLLALGLPAVALFLTIRLASRHFLAGLAGNIEFGRTPTRGWRPGLVASLGNRLTRSRDERTGFEFALAMAGREAMYLKGTLPQVIGFQVMALAMAANFANQITWAERLAPPLVLGFLLFLPPQLLGMSAMSKDGDARWLLCMSPRENFDEILRGATKGLLALAIPPAMLSALVLLFIFGLDSLLPIVLALELVTVAALYFTPKLVFIMPFTLTVGPRQKKLPQMGSQIAVVLTLSFAAACLVPLHLALAWNPWVLYAAIIALAPLTFLSFRWLERVRLRHALEA